MSKSPFLALLVLACATSGSRVGAEEVGEQSPTQFAAKIAGTWETSQGMMTLSARRDGLTGDVIEDGGRVFGKVDETGVFAGVWVKDAGEQTCSTKVDGSSHWGKFKLELSNDGQALSGVLATCETELTPNSTKWTGTRIPD
jgi:hypothetical protein